MNTKVIVIVGAGPGIGASLARRYGREGYDVALVARSAGSLERLGGELQEAGIMTGWAAADITDEDALGAAVTRFGEHRGRIDTLHFNPSRYRPADPLHLSADDLLEDLRLGCAGLLTAVQAARPFMREGSRVTVTGSVAADRPAPAACSLGVQKAALRNLVLSLDKTLAPDGIRATSLTVHGILAPDTAYSPDRVADALYDAARTPDKDWQAEVAYAG
jgi:NAD(P)-dependent dehydrogenase (short-subunit alcohol dehydrogenase family)